MRPPQDNRYKSALVKAMLPVLLAGQAAIIFAQAPNDQGDPWDSIKLDPKVRIKLSFRNANIDNVIMMLQQASHVTFVKDPALKGAVTVTTADPVSLSEAFHVFNSVLKLEGYELTRDRRLLVISKYKQPAPPPQTTNLNQPPPVEPVPLVVDWYPLSFANASQVARAINEVFQPFPYNPNQQASAFPNRQGGGQRYVGQQSPPVRVSYEEFSNSVIVNAPAAQQAEIGDLIKEIDVRQSEPQHTKSYALQFATSTDILPSIISLLTANLVKGKGWKGNNSLAQQFFGLNGGQNQNLAVADARTNSIIVTGSDELIKIADQVIETLDQKMSFAGTTFVFRLENARADAVANLLTAAFGQRQGTQNNNRNTVITPTNNSFNNAARGGRPAIKTGTNSKLPEEKTLAVPLQDPNADSGNLATSVGVVQGNRGPLTIGHDSGGKVVGVHDLSGQVTVIADPNTNSLIVVTAPDNIPMIKDIVAQLDEVPEQVMIQTVVVEATLDKSKQFGLEWSFAQNKAFGNTGTTGSLGQTFGLQNSTPPLQGFNYSLTGGDLSAFFNMLQADTKFQVLATPRIFTSNNMESQINISQSIPYIVSTIQNSNGTFSYNYAFQDVGIVLTVTPHITSNGYVSMDVLQTANDLQGYTSFNAPIVNQRQAETTISVKDGQTIILGGMIRNQVTSTVNRVPLLGDLPILGNLFRNSNVDHQKTELLVFLTPTVIRDPAEAKKLKEESEKELSPASRRLVKEAEKHKGTKDGG